jgi:hypothetical protein
MTDLALTPDELATIMVAFRRSLDSTRKMPPREANRHLAVIAKIQVHFALVPTRTDRNRAFLVTTLFDNEFPTRLSGHVVLGSIPTAFAEQPTGLVVTERIVLVDRGPSFTYGRFVTGVHLGNMVEWYGGHYFDDLAGAQADFSKRAKAARDL